MQISTRAINLLNKELVPNVPSIGGKLDHGLLSVGFLLGIQWIPWNSSRGLYRSRKSNPRAVLHAAGWHNKHAMGFSNRKDPK